MGVVIAMLLPQARASCLRCACGLLLLSFLLNGCGPDVQLNDERSSPWSDPDAGLPTTDPGPGDTPPPPTQPDHQPPMVSTLSIESDECLRLRLSADEPVTLAAQFAVGDASQIVTVSNEEAKGGAKG